MAKVWLVLIAAGTLAGAGSVAMAQDTSAGDSKQATMAIDNAPPRDDPFGLEGIAETVPGVAPPPVGFRPSQTRPKQIPEMLLRGIGRMFSDAAPTALLDIEGYGTFLVSVNDTISLQGLTGDNVMRIVEISDISVTVEAGSFGELIVLR